VADNYWSSTENDSNNAWNVNFNNGNVNNNNKDNSNRVRCVRGKLVFTSFAMIFKLYIINKNNVTIRTSSNLFENLSVN
jgi:hypothetical protein